LNEKHQKLYEDFKMAGRELHLSELEKVSLKEQLQ
jgi:hypothetical protein